MTSVITRYIERTRGWKPSEYRIESRGPSPDGASDVFAVVHRSDENSAVPGAGLSVELILNRTTQQVEKEIGGQ